MEETSMKEYAALAQLSKANRRSNQIFIALVVVLFLAAIFAGFKIYKSQQDSFKRRTAANAAAQQDMRIALIEDIRYHTCIDVLPVAERTPKAQRDCFNRVDLPGGLSAKDFVTFPPEQAGSALGSANSSPFKTPTFSSSSGAGRATSPSSSSTSSSQGTTTTPSPQPSFSQRVMNFVKRLF